jgi:hypothetical protein
VLYWKKLFSTITQLIGLIYLPALPKAVICVTALKFTNKHAHMVIIHVLICALLFALHLNETTFNIIL